MHNRCNGARIFELVKMKKTILNKCFYQENVAQRKIYRNKFQLLSNFNIFYSNDQHFIIYRFMHESTDFSDGNQKGPKCVLMRPRPF